VALVKRPKRGSGMPGGIDMGKTRRGGNERKGGLYKLLTRNERLSGTFDIIEIKIPINDSELLTFQNEFFHLMLFKTQA
jgi:hypothetical protein